MYVFGALDKQSQSSLASDSSAIGYYTELLTNDTYKSVLFSVALAHKMKIKETHEMNFGITYEHSGKLKGSQNAFLSRYIQNSSLQVGTVLPITSQESITFDLPKKLSFGFSYGSIEKYKVGLDINLAHWTSNNTNVQNTQEFILGGELTPDSRSVTNYLQRITYRFGLNYGKLPYLVQNNAIKEFGINFGASFPVAGLSTLDLAVKFGERGNNENGLVHESFMQIVLGLTVNEKWFIKRSRIISGRNKMNKLIIKITTLLFISTTAFGQAGWNWGVEIDVAKENNAIYTDMVKVEKYLEAVESHAWLLENTPDLNESLYQNGAKIYRALAVEETDKVQKAAYQTKALEMYDLRIKYFGNEASVLNRKAFPAYKFYKGDTIAWSGNSGSI